jgi:hypothetical protein
MVKLFDLVLKEFSSSQAELDTSFNNDSKSDRIRNSFLEDMNNSRFFGKKQVPSEYLRPNVHYYNSNEIYISGDIIIVGEYCNDGVIVPRDSISIVFDQLYNCSPLISLIKGDKEYLSFLHVWAIPRDSVVVDKQVEHWMKTVSDFGQVSETIFAPRKNGGGSDTAYANALNYIEKISKKMVLFPRSLNEIKGITNGKGVYFKECGYYLWNN